MSENKKRKILQSVKMWADKDIPKYNDEDDIEQANEMSDKFPRRVWIIEKTIGTVDFNYSEFICNSKPWNSAYGIPKEYLTVEEKDAIVSELERKLQRCLEVLRWYAPMEKTVVCPAKIALAEIEGTK